MPLFWLITLLIFGFVNGFGAINPLFWWLLLAMFLGSVISSK